MRLIALCLMLVWGMATVGNAETVVSFEPTTVSLGESAQLVFSSDNPLDQAPDLSKLTGNFAIAGQQQSMQTVTINGKTQTQYELIFNVFPRKSGTLTTEGVIVEGKPVKPAVLTVLEKGEQSSLPISFEARVNTDEAYPDETILYTVRLSNGAGLLAGQMSEPKVENARVVVLDMDKTWTENKEGRPEHIFERTFAITPEKEGYLTISPMEIYGSIATSATRRAADLFEQGFLFNGMIREQRNVRLETNPVQVKILKKPAEWKGWWLPSAQVTLSTKDDFPEVINVGSSLTRVVRLTALGIEAERLPVITQPGNQQITVYPSPEQRATVQTPVGDIQGGEEVSFIIVPQKSGKLTIPAIRIPWFNTRTRQIEEAVLPEKQIVVRPGAHQTTQAAPSGEVKKGTVVAQPQTTHRRAKPALAEKKNSASGDTKLAMPWVIGLIGIGILSGIGLGFLLFRRKKHHKKSYRLPTEAELKPKKKKKPLPDLYPF